MHSFIGMIVGLDMLLIIPVREAGDHVIRALATEAILSYLKSTYNRHLFYTIGNCNLGKNNPERQREFFT